MSIATKYKGKVSPQLKTKALNAFARYKSDKEELHRRILDNADWYRKRNSVSYREDTNELEASTSFVFSAIENRYADAVDNFPSVNLIERNLSDERTAQLLSKIIPVQLDMSGFKKVYKANWRKKLKYGTGIYGIFYDEEKQDIEIRSIDLLNVYCDMHVSDVQDSRFLFIVNAVDNDLLCEKYPQHRELFAGDASVEDYRGTTSADGKTVVVDCYYKKPDGTLHLMKLVDDNIIDATEDTEGYENGLYAHGMYPVVFDALYPEDNCPFGFGLVDIIKNPQMYIDRLDSAIIKNIMLSAKQRWIYKESVGVNEDDLMDYSKDLIKVQGDPSGIVPQQTASLGEVALAHLGNKIDRLKEIAGNRDFQQGGVNGGVTAASAITVLRQTGEKQSRALIDDSYDMYKDIIVMVIELMREFFTKKRIYRITDEWGVKQFEEFSNENLYHESPVSDVLGFDVGLTKKERVEVDIEVVPQKRSPYTRESTNELLLSLWKENVFSQGNIDSSVMLLRLMDFDGKEKLIDDLKKLKSSQASAINNI